MVYFYFLFLLRAASSPVLYPQFFTFMLCCHILFEYNCLLFSIHRLNGLLIVEDLLSFFLGSLVRLLLLFFCDRTWTLHSVLYSLVVSTNATQSMWEIYCSMNWMARNTPFYSTIDHWYWFGTAGLSPFQFVYPSPAEFIIVQLVCQSPSQSFSWMTRRYVWVCGWLFIYHLTVYLINTIRIKTIQSANYFNTISEISLARKIEERLIHWMKRGE